ncbi:MAG: hypothetical protein GW762_00845 [Candidatus Pacebacteria bacterium]|nr:hypothetical protein [Candidatus Paceibacterota bacterium]PIR63540.1 MAG: hypothetical protein COU64_03700 [Candidatus Pacebacteria bacterium CG10_big_fil_rev_8_21_14_0_10_40_26]PIZ79194.1 MAG: hypothetical protein COY01_02075 [Candidatus Pacebacteria bacterium CG_4_10_14_0_2_um_filter_40_20]PJA68849.1 MAG: hypothetical protein CO156_02680 [Candidatus Pacebacteria bacterium CG_4_9_14_3_um_filter_40_12]PJC42160.1 MAG: hypothetical protein CO041_00785 [Candidatus Pacebacteria bacterium CG_4_9_
MILQPETLSQDVLAFMRKTSIMSAAINGAPPISTVLLFTVDDDFTMYFATLEGSYKVRGLQKDGQMSIAIWEHHELYLQGSGVASIVADPNKVTKIVDRLADSAVNIADFWPPVLQIKGHDYVVFELKLSWLRARDLSDTTIVEKTTKFMEVPLDE